MAISISQKIRLKQSLILVLLGLFLGPFYVIFSDGFGDLFPFINSAIGGVLVALLVSALEIWWFRKGLNSLPFYALILLRTLLYGIGIFVLLTQVLIIARMLKYELSYSGVLGSEEFINYILYKDFLTLMVYSLILALGVNFTRLMSRKMGQGMLLGYISGHFIEPREQQRIVMFMRIRDIADTGISQDPFKYHRFLNRLYADLAEPILARSGNIYEYVEELVVITWPLKQGFSKANCLEIFFDCQQTLDSLSDTYQKDFGFQPKLMAGIHFGPLVRSEVGDRKAQIVFHGDLMNSSARILGQCRDLHSDLLASADLVNRIKNSGKLDFTSRGAIGLKGKTEKMELYEIGKKDG